MPPPPLVLVVEDNAADAKLIRILLEAQGCAVRVVQSAEEAVGQLAGELPDLILADIDLPGMDGLALAARLGADARTRGLPVVAMTSTSGFDAPVRARAAGCVAFLPKPVDTATFPSQLAGWLARRPAS